MIGQIEIHSFYTDDEEQMDFLGIKYPHSENSNRVANWKVLRVQFGL